MARGPRPVLVAAVLLLAASSAFGAASASCTARHVGERVLADVVVRDLFDDEAVRLIRLGLRGRLRIEAAVTRRQWLVVRQLLAETATERVVSAASSEAGLRVDDGAEIGDLKNLSLGRLSLVVGRRHVSGASVEVRVQLAVITASSLRGAASWLSSRREGNESLIERGVLSAVAEDLSRRVTATCTVGRVE